MSILKFAPISQTYQQFGSALLFAGFWDGNMIIYQAQLPTLGDQAQTQIMLQGSTGGVPILGAIWCIDQVGVLLACADNNIKKWDLQSNKVVNVGSHAQPVKDLYMFNQNNTNVVVSGGWDSRVKFWTWANPNQLSQVGESILEKPIQYMSGEYPLLVTAHSGLKIHYWDLKKIFSGIFNPQGVMTSPLKESTSCIQCFADGKGFVIGSIEGRCGVKNIDLENNKINTNDDFCFKSHRIEEFGAFHDQAPIKAFTINGISFNRTFNTFATYGQDGCYFFWNKDTKSKLKSTKAAPWPVTAADYLENATMFAFSYGYDWGKGAEEAKKKEYPITIYIRKVKEDEAFKKKF